MQHLLGRVTSPRAIGNGFILSAMIAGFACFAFIFGSAATVYTATNFMALLVGAISLTIFSGNTGILSFGHVAFMALGAQIGATLTIPANMKVTLFPLLPEWLLQLELSLVSALLVTVLLVALVAFLTGLVISKLAASAVPLTTLGLLIIVNSLIIGADGITRGSQAVYGTPKLVDLPIATIAAIAACWIAILFRYSSLGLAARAVREDEAAAAAIGVDQARVRMIAWIVSAAVAGAGGCILAHILSVFSPKDFFFDLSFFLIVMIVVGGMASVSGAVLGATVVTVAIEILRRLENGFAIGPLHVPQIFGLTQIGLCIAILATLYLRPQGILGFREVADFLKPRRPPAPVADTGAAKPPASQNLTLTLENVSKHFGGLSAVKDVKLEIRQGEIVGLIGPNGSGKSTLLACIGGSLSASSGSIRLASRDLTGLPAQRVARLGIARNFQNVRLFKNLTVLENVQAAVVSSDTAVSLGEAEARAEALLRDLKILPLANRMSGELAYGQQRRVEIARALALNPKFLLLDEPAAGMNEQETESLLDILAWLTHERGLGLLIVDHDMPLIMRLCNRVLVLNHGQMIAAGSPAEVQANPLVHEAYFGRRGRAGHRPGNISLQAAIKGGINA